MCDDKRGRSADTQCDFDLEKWVILLPFLKRRLTGLNLDTTPALRVKVLFGYYINTSMLKTYCRHPKPYCW